jgi:hypothetical protein
VPLGGPAFQLPDIDDQGTADVDLEFNMAVGAKNYSGELHFADVGTNVELDDILFGPQDVKSVCQTYIDYAL